MRLEIVGTGNTKEAQASVDALTAQVEVLNKAMERTTMLSKGATPKSYAQTAAALAGANATFKNALASTGRFQVQQVKLNDATEHYTKLLQNQNLGFKQVFGPKNKALMDSIYHRQLQMKNLTASMISGAPGTGSLMATMAIPNTVPRSWDNLANRVGFASERLRSAGQVAIKTGKNMQWAGRQLTVGLTMPIAAFAAATGVAAYKADQQFTRIRKVYNTTANQFSADTQQQVAAQKELDAVRAAGMKTATDAAKEYGVSMSDTLSVQADLAATGQRGAALQEATTAVVKNATLGEIDYATATKATIAMQQQLHLSSKELADTWAYMNSVENSTSLTMKDFAAAIPIALGPLKLMGGDVKTLGTLLTGLVSRGIQVGKAANAIKAAAQRLIRPSAQVQAEFKAMTGEDIVQIGKRNKGNLLGMLQDIYKVTKDLSQYDRTKVFAGLFGSFQLSTMSAMVNSMGDLSKGIGQVSEAERIGQQDAKNWRQVQEGEINAFQKSLSGKLKRSAMTVVAELAQMGMPFLSLATNMLGALAKVLHIVNSFPHAAKVIGGFGLAFIALFGPVKMLMGLMMNLRGGIMSITGSVGMKLTGWTGTVTAENKLLAISAENVDKAFMTEAEATAALTANLEALNYAMQQTAQRASTLSHGNIVLPPVVGTGAVADVSQMTREQRLAYYRSQAPSRTAGGQFASSASKDVYAAQQLAKYENETAASSAKAAANTSKMATGAKLAAGGGALLAASMVTTMVSSNKTVDNIAQWGMMLGMMAPLIATPIGAAVAGVGLVTLGVYKWWQHEKAITEERRAQNLALYKQNDELNATLDIETKRLKTMQSISVLDAKNKGGNGPTVQDVATSYGQSDIGKQMVGSVQNAASEQERLTIATKQYFDVLQARGGDVQKAKMAVAGLFFAAGDSMGEAAAKAEQLYKMIGSTVDFTEKSKLFVDELNKALKGDDTSIAQQGSAIGALLIDSMKNSTAKQAPHLLDGLDKIVKDSWNRNFAGLDKLSALVFQRAGISSRKAFDSAIGDIGNMASGDMSKGNFLDKYGLRPEELDPFITAINKMQAALSNDKGLKLEQAVVGEFVKQLHLSKDITTLEQLRAEWQYKLQFATKENTKELFKQRVAELTNLGWATTMLGVRGKLTDKQREGIMNEIKAAREMNGYNTELDSAKNKAAGVNNELSKMPDSKHISITADFSNSQVASIRQEAMTGVMSDMANSATSLMDSQAQAAMDAAQAAGQRRIDAAQAAGQHATDALQARQQREQDAFDKHWQHREDVINKFYDNQENKIDKELKAEQRAEEIRQRIYEAEQARLDHLTESTNRTIDFNVALQTGQLDEAARIQNDMEASATTWALSQQGTKEANKSQDKQARLNDLKDRLEKERQARLKSFQKEEDAARKHLEKVQAMEQKHLQASIDAHQKAVQTQVDNQNAALQAEWDARKQNLADQLTLFQSYVAKNKGDLDKWMTTVGLQYSDFGINTLSPMSDKWGGYFQDAFLRHLHEAGAKVASDNMWQALGKNTSRQLLAGMGFPTMAGFKHFIATGELPGDFGKKPKNLPTNHNGPSTTSAPHPGGTQDGPTRIASHHTGGVFGMDAGSRLGRSGKLRADEGYALLKHGEMVMNPAATMKYLPVLKKWNAEGLGIGGESPSVAGLVSGVSNKMMAQGVSAALKMAWLNAKLLHKQNKNKGPSGLAGGYVPGPGGKHRPVPGGIGLSQGLHDVSTGYAAVDFAAPLNTPTYAVGDGVITRSEAITSGGSPGNGLYSIPYRSYGNVEYLKLDGGPTVLYAHLNKRMVAAGTRVSGGAKIGLTGNTGNSTGPHLHFGDSDGNPYEFMRKGGEIVRDGKFYGHGGEKVLTAPLSKALDRTVHAFGELSADPKLRYNLSRATSDSVGAALRGSQRDNDASGDVYEYNIPIQVLEPGASADEIARTVLKTIKQAEGRKPTRRTNR